MMLKLGGVDRGNNGSTLTAGILANKEYYELVSFCLFFASFFLNSLEVFLEIKDSEFLESWVEFGSS